MVHDASVRLLAVIPARGGSRGIPGKNLVRLAGRSLVERAVDVARAARGVSAVVVSTDDPRIARAAARAGAQVLMRPARLATDSAPGLEVLRHAVGAFERAHGPVARVALLQPTSPLRTPADIEAGAALLDPPRVRVVVGMCPASAPPEWMFRARPGRAPQPIARFDRRFSTPRQRLGTLLQLNGALYLFDRDHLASGSPVIGPWTRAHLMPRSRSVDIDEEDDLRIAEALLNFAESRAAGGRSRGTRRTPVP